jgi:hypothetical protein
VNATCFSQRDPSWQKEKLGSGIPTIGVAGCLITAVASALTDAASTTNPRLLNRWLTTHGGYWDDNLFVFNSVEPLGLHLVSYIQCAKLPAPINELSLALGAGQFVIAEVDSKPGGSVNQHWVRIADLSKSSGWIMDPWQLPGYEMIGLNAYLERGWSPARGIFAALIYSSVDREAVTAAQVPSEHQKSLAIRTN